jgi:hypothetical protein
VRVSVAGTLGTLTEAGLDQLIIAGCTACQSPRLAFRSYVDGRIPVVAGEPVGAITWVYDGEKFVDGVFEVACADCQQVVFTSDVCPRCNAAGALPEVLATGNTFPVPTTCPRCGEEELRYTALIPARVIFQGKRADKARTSTELHDPGFHGLHAVCADCGPVAAVSECCPLCARPGPLRPRP